MAYRTRTLLTSLLALACLFAILSDQVVAEAKPNVLFIAIDDLRCDVGAFGIAHAKTPQLDSFAASARVFTHHYVQAPTCGASRCALMRGRYPTAPAHVGNDGILRTHSDWGEQSLPAVFRAAGYRTLAVGKLTHYPGGRTGKNWTEGPEELPGAWERAWIPDGPWKNAQTIMHGYADGVSRQPGKSPPWETHDGPDEAYPDAWVAADAVKTLRELAESEKPWFFGVGFFKPHLPFAAPQRWHDLHAAGVPDVKPEAAAKPSWPSGWHGSGEFRGNYGNAGRDPNDDAEYAQLIRRAYGASVSYMDAQVGHVLDELRRLGLDGDTIVVVWSDHGFLLGEHAIWGKHCLYEQALRSPLIIRYPGLQQPGRASQATVETVDVFPTLTDLCGLEAPASLDGRSLRPQLNDADAPVAKPSLSFWTGGQRTIRTDRWRLIVHPVKGADDPQVELFDYETDSDETRNLASAHPEVVADLLARLNEAPAISAAKRSDP